MEKNAHMKKIGSRRAGHFRLAAWPAVAVAGAIAIPTAIAIAIFSQSAIAATAPVGLGTAGSYAVLAGSTVTNTGPSVISGNLGVSPGTAVTGFPPGTVNSGTIHAADAAAGDAQADLTTAYNDAAGRVKSASIGGFIGAGQTLGPGVYNATSSLDVGGSLTLDAQGDPNAVFIFQAGSTLGTDTGTTILLTHGAQACNVFWQVGSSATLTTGSTFQGTILALTSITVQTGDTITGRALARNGAVTLDDDTIIVPSCTTGTGPTPTGTGTGTTRHRHRHRHRPDANRHRHRPDTNRHRHRHRPDTNRHRHLPDTNRHRHLPDTNRHRHLPDTNRHLPDADRHLPDTKRHRPSADTDRHQPDTDRHHACSYTYTCRHPLPGDRLRIPLPGVRLGSRRSPRRVVPVRTA